MMKALFCFLLLVATSLSAVAQDLHPVWVPYKGTMPANAVVGGRESNKQPLFVGRANYQTGTHPGKTRKDWDHVNIEYGGKEVSVKTFEILLADGFVMWQRPDENGVVPFALSGGTENDHDMNVCRSAFANGVHIGKTWPGLGACNIGYAGTGLGHPDYEVLVDPWVSSNKGLPEKALAGGVDTDGATLYVARALNNSIWQPAKTQEAWSTANVGFNTQELVIENYEFLLDDGNFTWQPFKGVLPKNAVWTDKEQGVNMWICRGKHLESTQVGRVFKGNCNIGYGGAGLMINTFEVLTYSKK